VLRERFVFRIKSPADAVMMPDSSAIVAIMAATSRVFPVVLVL
jgi:hypothetical protein